MMHWDMYGGGMGFGWLFMIFFGTLVVIGVAAVIQILAKKAASPKQGETALDILKMRYAKGEINKEKFDRMKDDLMKP